MCGGGGWLHARTNARDSFSIANHAPTPSFFSGPVEPAAPEFLAEGEEDPQSWMFRVPAEALFVARNPFRMRASGLLRPTFTV